MILQLKKQQQQQQQQKLTSMKYAEKESEQGTETKGDGYVSW